jgi:hypothetical protein
MWEAAAADEWRGIGEADVCIRCRYRSVCTQSAAKGEPSWPALSLGGPG